MTTDLLERSESRAGLSYVDCDVHPGFRTAQDLKPFLSARWQEHLATFGGLMRQPFTKMTCYPRYHSAGNRADAWPPSGGHPGSDLAFMRQQHLDPNGVEYGMLMPPVVGQVQRNLEFGAALCSAVNDWQLAHWVRQDKRLKAAIIVHPDYPEAAVAEIERRAGDGGFVQVALPPRADEPLGRRRYWPIYAAAAAHGLPIGLHVTSRASHPATGTGWPSFYIEEHHSSVHGMMALLTSLVLEGVFAKFPSLKVVLIESGIAWVPALCWRLDKHWARLRAEVPHVTRPPSEYIREHVWYTTQPIEEPETPDDLLTLIDWIGWDRLLFSSDYPHWDFDDPRTSFKVKLTTAQRRQIFNDNARAVYRLG